MATIKLMWHEWGSKIRKNRRHTLANNCTEDPKAKEWQAKECENEIIITYKGFKKVQLRQQKHK